MRDVENSPDLASPTSSAEEHRTLSRGATLPAVARAQTTEPLFLPASPECEGDTHAGRTAVSLNMSTQEQPASIAMSWSSAQRRPPVTFKFVQLPAPENAELGQVESSVDEVSSRSPDERAGLVAETLHPSGPHATRTRSLPPTTPPESDQPMQVDSSDDPASPTLPPEDPLALLAEFRRLFEPRNASTYSFVQPTAPEALLPVQVPSTSVSTVVHRKASVGEKRVVPTLADTDDDDEIEFIGESPPKRPRLGDQKPLVVQRDVQRGRQDLARSQGSRSTFQDLLEEEDTPLREITSTPPPLMPRNRNLQSSGTGRGGRVLPEEVRYKIALMGNVHGNDARPLGHIQRLFPELNTWEKVTRYVGARPEDAERVRHTTASWMRDGASRARKANIL